MPYVFDFTIGGNHHGARERTIAQFGAHDRTYSPKRVSRGCEFDQPHDDYPRFSKFKDENDLMAPNVG